MEANPISLPAVAAPRQGDPARALGARVSRVAGAALWRALPLLPPALVLLAWQVIAAHRWIAPQILPPPAVVLDTLVTLAADGELWPHLRVSLQRVALGFGLAAVVGLAGGALLGLSRIAEAALTPLFKVYAQTPVIAWMPFGILLLGIEERLLVALIASAAVVPVLAGTHEGVRNISPAHLEVGRVYGYSGWRLLRRVVVPAALPQILVGLRFALNQAWLTLVAAELVGTTEGVGYLIVESRELFQLDVVLAAILVLGLAGILLEALFSRVEASLPAGSRK